MCLKIMDLTTILYIVIGDCNVINMILMSNWDREKEDKDTSPYLCPLIEYLFILINRLSLFPSFHPQKNTSGNN